MPHYGEHDNSKRDAYVKSLQQRIFHAARSGDKRSARKLQRLLLHSKANLTYSIDMAARDLSYCFCGSIEAEETAKEAIFAEMSSESIYLHKPKKFTRSQEKKAQWDSQSFKPFFKDRIAQCMIRNALEPQIEATLSPSIYGFRHGRDINDAIGNAKNVLLTGKSEWIAKGQLRLLGKAFKPNAILEEISNFPAKDIIAKWLEAGFMEKCLEQAALGSISPSEQLHLIMPLLLNMAASSIEKQLNAEHLEKENASVQMVSYQTEIAFIADNAERALDALSQANNCLEAYGLKIEADSLEPHNIAEGFDLSCYTLRKYKDNTQKSGYRLLAKPSNASLKEAKKELKKAFKESLGYNSGTLIRRINRCIQSIALPWISQSSKDAFSKLDFYIWKNAERFLKRSHPKKPWKWIRHRYFSNALGKGMTIRDPETGASLLKLRWFKQKALEPISSDASIYDASLKEYFSDRKRRKRKNSNRIRQIVKEALKGSR